MLKYIGILTVLIAAVMPAVDYRRLNAKRICELEYFILLIGGIKDRLRYMRPLGEYIRRSDTSRISYALSGGEELLSDVCGVMKKLSFSRETKEKLSEYFSSLGEGSAKRELFRADELLTLLSNEIKEERERGGKGLRVRFAVSAAVGLSLVILLI